MLQNNICPIDKLTIKTTKYKNNVLFIQGLDSNQVCLVWKHLRFIISTDNNINALDLRNVDDKQIFVNVTNTQ